MKVYLVGGAVRDALLGLDVKDKDYVVVGATPQQMSAAGYMPVGADFPVFLHPETKAEYALARTEHKSGQGYKGFTFNANPSVTLEEDLLRRDLTINAIVQDEDGKYIDPYGGQADIQNKVLRHVSPAFAEDPLRVLRVARFYARFYHLGFCVVEETKILMQNLSESGELAHLTPERIWAETEKALNTSHPDKFIALLHEVGALKTIMPEVDALYGVPQPPKWHPEIDTGIHVELVLHQAVKLSTRPEIRFAALMHDLGKARTPKEKWPSHHGHEQLGVKPVTQLCERLKVPNRYKHLALKVTEFHGHTLRAFEMKPKTIHALLKSIGAIKSEGALEDFLTCCLADSRGRPTFETAPYPQVDYLRDCAHAVWAIKPSDLIAQGLQGEALGQAIEKAQIKAIAKVKSATLQAKR